ncbi:hypothetical protein FS749_009993, partial [Ceratobasidium sp. UAMH 11750]
MVMPILSPSRWLHYLLSPWNDSPNPPLYRTMKPLRIVAACSLLASAVDAAINLYADESDLPDGVSSTTTCGKALNASIACDVSIGAAGSGALLPVATLNTLCVSTCYTALKSYRSSIVQACGNSTIIQGSDATFPITYIADSLLYSYNSTCLKD